MLVYCMAVYHMIEEHIISDCILVNQKYNPENSDQLMLPCKSITEHKNKQNRCYL